MKPFALLAVIVCSLASAMPAIAEETNTVNAQFSALIREVRSMASAGKNSESELAPDLKRFDEIVAAHKNEKSDDVARVLVGKAMLYFQVLNDPKSGVETMELIRKEYPNTKSAENASMAIESYHEQERIRQLQNELQVGKPFPGFSVTNSAGKPFSPADYKGKVLLIDFWGTFCPPCMAEMPNLLKLYEKFHPKGFEIIGVNFDPVAARAREYLSDAKIPWPQYIDGKGWDNVLGRKFGIYRLPSTFLLDGDGTIIARDVVGEPLADEVAKAIKAQPKTASLP